jgi:hypothetical protein
MSRERMINCDACSVDIAFVDNRIQGQDHTFAVQCDRFNRSLRLTQPLNPPSQAIIMTRRRSA